MKFVCMISVGLALCCAYLFYATLPYVLQCYSANSSILWQRCYVIIRFLLRSVTVTLRCVVLRYISIFTLFRFKESSTKEISGRMLTPSTPLFTARWRRLLPSTSMSYRKSSTVPWLSAAIKQSGYWIRPTRYQLLVSNRNISKSAVTHQIHTLL